MPIISNVESSAAGLPAVAPHGHFPDDSPSGVMNSKNEPDSRREDQAARGLFARSSLYREFLAEREEVLKHKWFEPGKSS